MSTRHSRESGNLFDLPLLSKDPRLRGDDAIENDFSIAPYYTARFFGQPKF